MTGVKRNSALCFHSNCEKLTTAQRIPIMVLPLSLNTGNYMYRHIVMHVFIVLKTKY